MDFVKFVDLLECGTLWFRRVDLLDDPREGLLADHEFARLSERPDGMARSVEALRSLSHVNCWHESDVESMAMWDLYGANGWGVAIKTTVKSLKDAIANAEPIHIGRVEYLDWKQHDGDPANAIGLCVRKSDAYMHENEVRLVFWAPSTEQVRHPGAARDGPIDGEGIARDVLTALSGLLPSCDFTSIDGRSLVVRALLARNERERLKKAGAGICISVDRSTLVHDVVVGPKAQS